MKYPTYLSLILSLFLCLFFTNGAIQAQKFGDIDINRLKEEVHPSHSDASHAYIFKNSYVRYDLQSRSPRLITEFHYRIKIYTDGGVNQANIIKYIYRNGNDREAIKDVKAECHNFVNGKDETIKLSKKDIFKEEIDETITKVSFAIPNARVGSIIEYKYKISSPFLYSFPRHYFQEDVPVDYSKFTVDIPNYFTMAPIATGLIPLNSTQETKKSFGADVTQYTFDVSNIPGIEDDKYVLDIQDYKSSLKYELSEIAFPGQQVQSFTKDWKTVCENLMESRAFGDAIDSKVKQAEALLMEIAEHSEAEKVVKIVDFINTNISWNGNFGHYGSTNYKKLFEAKKGDVADINLLLINLCRKAGLSAYPILTKSRFHGILNTNYPSLTEINYVFAMVEIDGNLTVVDATSSYFEPGTVPLRALNIKGILMKEGKNYEIELINTNLNYKRRAAEYIFNFDENRLEGTGKIILKGYAAVKARKEAREKNDEEDQQDLEIDLNAEAEEDDEDIETEEEDVYVYSVTDGFDNKYGDISGSFDSQLYSPIDKIGDEVYVNAFVSLEFDENPFLKEIRKYPAFFNSKHHINHISILDIPEGYVVKSKPENIILKMINDKGQFSYATNESPGKITINALFKINDDIFLPEEYSSLYEFFNQVLLKQKEKIVLVKK